MILVVSLFTVILAWVPFCAQLSEQREWLQNQFWVKPSIWLILGQEVTESEVERQNSLGLHRPAASTDDGGLASFFFIVNLLFYFDTLFFCQSGRKCQAANTTPDKFLMHCTPVCAVDGEELKPLGQTEGVGADES